MSEVYLCRLCLEEASHLFDVYSAIGKKLNISEIVAQHFWFSIYENDELSNKICTICWSKINDFHQFYNSVQKAQDNVTIIVDNSKYTTVDGVIVDDAQTTTTIEIHLNNKCIEEDQKIEVLIDDSVEELTDYKIQTQLNEYFEDDNDDNHSSEADTKDIQSITIETSSPQSTIEVTTTKNQSVEEPPPLSAVVSTDTSTDLANFVKKRSQRLINLKKLIKCNTKDDEYNNLIDETQTNETIDRNEELNKNDADLINSKTKKQKLDITSQTKITSKTKKKIAQAETDRIIETFFQIKCELCDDDELNTLQELLEHYPKKHSIRGFILCCGKKLFKRNVLAEHVLFHQKPDLFRCSKCDNNKLYDDKRSLENHNMIYHITPDTKLYKCEHCDKTFTLKLKFDQHNLTHLAPEEKKYKCLDCEKPYASHGLLRAHIRVVHEKTYAHMCEICAKVFKSRAFFEKHQLEHMGKKLPKVQCHVCNAWLKNEHTMRAHIRLHQDEDVIHKCEICGKIGPSRNAILKHKRFVHLSERKFKCNLCDKAFKRQITLKEHMSTHTGEILYSCTFCAKTFNSGANMHAHRKKAHPVEWENDKICKSNLLRPE